MKICEWCNLTEEERKWLVLESANWTVYLADIQDYVGRCILVANRHCGNISDLNISEWTELKELIDKLEKFYKEILGADLCNWSCLMNSFHKKISPNPHVHIHVRPRYKQPIIINGRTYVDTEFGHHYILSKDTQLCGEDRLTLFQQIRDYLNS